MIAVDASVLIAHLNPSDALHDRAQEMLASCPPFKLAVSAVTLAEVLVGPARTGRVNEVRNDVRRLEPTVVAVDVSSSGELAALRARTGLKLSDCCVLHAAQTVDAGRVLTLDVRLAEKAAKLGFDAG